MFVKNTSSFYLDHDCFVNPEYEEVVGHTINRYRLEFIPAPDAANYNPRTRFEFPKFSIDAKVSFSCDFEEEIPRGMQVASEMKIKIDIGSLTGDFSPVKQWILEGQAQTEIAPTDVYGSDSNPKPVRLPHMWILHRVQAEATNGSPIVWRFWKPVFIGYQVPSVEKKIKYNKKTGTQTFEFSVYEMTQWVGEKFDFDAQYNGVVLNTAGTDSEICVNRYIDLEYYNTTPWGTKFYRQLSTAADNHRYVFKDFDSFFNDYIQVYNSFTRVYYGIDEYHFENCSTSIFKYWEFFKQADSSPTFDKVSLGSYSPKFLAWIVDRGNQKITGGFFCPSDPDGVVAKYKTAWDFIKNLCLNWCVRMRVDYYNRTFNFSPLIDNVETIDLTANDIIADELEYTYDYNIAGEGIAHLGDDEYSWNRFGTLVDTTDEGEYSHSSWLPPIQKYTDGVAGFNINGVSCVRLLEARLDKPAYDGLYFSRKYDGYAGFNTYEMFRIHPVARVFLNEAKTVMSTNDNIFTAPEFASQTKDEWNDNLVENAKIWRDYQLSISSLARSVWANIVSNSNNAQLQIPIETDKITMSDLGKKVNIPLADLGLEFMASKKPKIFITNIQYDDLNTNKTKVNLFVTADGRDI